MQSFNIFTKLLISFKTKTKTFIYPDRPLWPKSSAKKEDFRLKSDLIWQNPFLTLWKLKFNIIQFGYIRFWAYFYVFCVRYKVFSVYFTLSRTEKSSDNKEDFRFKWDLIWQKTICLNFWNSSVGRTSSPFSWKVWKYSQNWTLFHP